MANPMGAEEKRTIKTPHNVIMENRKSLMVTGVTDVDSFDEQTVVVYTDMGELTVRGSNLHIAKLNVDTGELSLTGTVYGLAYTDDRQRQGGGLFGRLFR